MHHEITCPPNGTPVQNQAWESCSIRCYPSISSNAEPRCSTGHTDLFHLLPPHLLAHPQSSGCSGHGLCAHTPELPSAAHIFPRSFKEDKKQIIHLLHRHFKWEKTRSSAVAGDFSLTAEKRVTFKEGNFN